MNGEVRIGFATAPITPPLPVHLSGYGARSGQATEVHDDLEVRVLVATDDEHTLVLLALDLMAMSEDWATPIRDAVATALGCERAAVVTSCVHTHAAPSTLTGTDPIGWVVPVHYREPLTAACVAAARAAADGVEPARVAYARAPLPAHLSFDRRGHPYAPTFAVADVIRPDGTRLGTVANAGVHPVVLGPRNLSISADWVGPCRRSVEAVGGGTAVFLQGCQGDVDPEGRAWDGEPEEWFAAVEKVGAAMAGAVLDARARAEPVDGRVAVAAERVLTVDVTGSPLSALGGVRDRLEVELIEWDLAGVRLVTVPGEAFSGFAARVVGARRERLLLAGLSPHWLGYLPEPFTDGYEEGLSYGAPAVSSILDAIAHGPA